MRPFSECGFLIKGECRIDELGTETDQCGNILIYKEYPVIRFLSHSVYLHEVQQLF